MKLLERAPEVGMRKDVNHIALERGLDGALNIVFFEELGDGAQVRAMVYAGRGDKVRTSYRERPHVLQIEPIREIVSANGAGGPPALNLVAFRDKGIFYEAVTNQILDDLVAACAPRRMTVVGDFTPRGGIKTVVTARFDQPAG